MGEQQGQQADAPLHGVGNAAAILQLQDIDPAFEHERKQINSLLETLPSGIPEIRELLGLQVTPETYALFNDVRGFHSPDKPWKRENDRLVHMLTPQ